MSYSIDRSRAVALQQRDGVWSLEVEQLVRVTRNTFRPKRQRVTGAEAIVQHLLLHHGPLVGSTRQVLEQGAGRLEARFELQGSGWVPVPELEEVEIARPAPPPRPEPRPSLPSPGRAPPAAVLEEIETLASRLDHLEKTVALLAEELATGGGGGVSDEESEALLSAAMAGAGPSDTPPEPQAAPAPEPEPEPEPDFKALKLPQLEAVADLVKGLAGDEISMSIVDAKAWNFQGGNKGYFAPLNSDKGEVIGALVLDLEGTIRLAGGMLMEPKDELDAQVEDGTPSDDILDAAGEVLNTLTSAVNKVSGNLHVRAGGLEELNTETHAWLLKPRVRGDFKCSVGGKVVIIGR